MEYENARRIFSDGLSRFIRRKGYTLKELADIMQVSQPSMCNMRSGKCLPTFDKVFTLIENGMKLDEIFGRELAERLAPSPVTDNAEAINKAIKIQENMGQIMELLNSMKNG